MAADLLGGEGDRGEGILDLVGDAAGDLFPGGLLLCAQELGGVFEDEDVALVFARRLPGTSRSATVASRFMVLLKLAVVSVAGGSARSRRRRSPCGGCAG